MPTDHLPRSVTAELVPTRGGQIGIGVAIRAACTTLGRGRDCDIVLDDSTVSARHAELHRDEHTRYTLIDLGSFNGIYLNRHPMHRAELADGDEIWIGKSRFLFRRQSGLASATSPT